MNDNTAIVSFCREDSNICDHGNRLAGGAPHVERS